jgi:adenosine deaminase
MHLGEHGEEYGTENIHDAIIMGVTRIGHGPLLFEEPLLLEYQCQKNPNGDEHSLKLAAQCCD